MQQNKTKAKQSKTTTKCISLLLVSNTARTHIFHPIQKYSIHQPHSLCAILYCTCVSIELVFFSFIRLFCSKNFCVLKFHCSIEFNGIRIFFFYIHTLRKKVTRLLFYCCVCIFFLFKASSFLSTSVSKTVKRRIIENAAVSRRIRNTQYDGMYSYTCNLLKHPQPNALLNFQCRCMKMIGDK